MKLTIDEREELQDLTAHKGWKILASKLPELAKDVEYGLKISPIEPNSLIYERGKVDGAHEMIRIITDFKDSLRGKKAENSNEE